MNSKFFIRKLKFNDGTVVDIEPSDLVIFVGANNSGKSASLKGIYSKIERKDVDHQIIKDLSIGTNSDIETIFNDIKNISSKSGDYFNGYNYRLYIPNLKNKIQRHDVEGLQDTKDIFVEMLTTESRLTAVNPAKSIDLLAEAINHPIHFLQESDEKEKEFCGYFREAFGKDLVVYRNGGSVVPLVIGDKPNLEGNEDRLSLSYQSKLQKLEKLHEQGDGMKSFVGVLLQSFIDYKSILLLDEPEAFLHPPQARLLGKMIARRTREKKQIFVSTHSESLLKSLIDNSNTNLKIIRLVREGNINKVNILDNDDIINIWKDSLLRHSNILDGLFHSKVVVCESDADCKFYSALLSEVFDGEHDVISDILFVHCNGKHRMPSVVAALKKLSVPIKVVADFDILSSESPLKNIVDLLGGDWNELEKDWKLVKKTVDNKRPPFETQNVKEKIEEILKNIDVPIFPIEKSKEIASILKRSSPWSEAKSSGRSYISNGDPTMAFDKMNNKLIHIGLLIPITGELESFAASIPGHGPKWVEAALQKDLKNDRELEYARNFVRKILED